MLNELDSKSVKKMKPLWRIILGIFSFILLIVSVGGILFAVGVISLRMSLAILFTIILLGSIFIIIFSMHRKAEKR